MSISQIQEKIKEIGSREELILPVVIVLVAATSFAFGRLSTMPDTHTPIYLTTAPFATSTTAEKETENETAPPVSSRAEATVVGSANSDVYHFPWCPGAQRINAENKISFNSSEEARAEGYRPAKNCKGLE